MNDTNSDLNMKFVKFRESYEAALFWLADAGGSAEQKETSALNAARRAVDASEIEFDFFTKLMKEEIPKPT